MTSRDALHPGVEEEASETFIQREHGEWTPQDQAALDARLAIDVAYAQAYRSIEASWRAMGRHAESPEVLAYREQAIAVARQSNVQRWLKTSPMKHRRWYAFAAAAGVAFVLVTAWLLSPYGYRPGEYRTGIGEQRALELHDHSRITLDAATRLRVRYSNDVREIELKEGQAQFSVAADPTRPFKVRAGNRTIVALGTVFTVEYVDRRVRVAMMEGRVAVVSSNPHPPSPMPSTPVGEPAGLKSDSIELSAGEELRVSQAGQSSLIPNADIEAATAWRDGKVIFRGEPLRDAVRRFNRYSRVQIQIMDETLANRRINGVFNAGDPRGFVSDLERYLPLTVDTTGSDTLRLERR